MRSVADSDRDRPSFHMPAVRRRFVTRAGYLKERPEFLRALAEARAIWEQRFPDYAIGEPQYLPPDDAARGSPFAVYPPRLDADVNTVNARPLSARGSHDDLDNRTCEGAHVWHQIVHDLCISWWPREYFPAWATFGPANHPAGVFVSACLVYRPESVPEEWIIKAGVSAVAGEPRHVDRDGVFEMEAAYWRCYSERLESVIEAAMTDVDLDAMRRDARKGAIHARQESSRRFFQEYGDMRDWHHYVTLFPGMTASDWRAMEPYVLRWLDTLYGAVPAAQHAKRLRDSGMSIRQIAFMLGISQRQAARYVKEAA